jgi:hypothetical protein
VPPAEGRKQANGKQRRGNDEEELKCWCHDAVYLASGERTRLACWRARPRDRGLCLDSLTPQRVRRAM